MQNVCSERQIVNTIGISILYDTYVEYLYFLWYFYIIKQLKMQKPSISIFLNSMRVPEIRVLCTHMLHKAFQSRIRQNFEK